MIIRSTIALLIVLFYLPSVALAGKRVALVIGNGSYVHAAELPNPPHDSGDMAAALRSVGFDVIEGTSLDKSAFEKNLRTFSARLKGADVGVFYYSGHGLQFGGINYLVPVDAKLSTADALDFEMVRLDIIQKIIEREAKTSILILDACRNNPLSRNLAQSLGTRGGEIGRGLAPSESGAGTLISYSTQPGNVALDGDGRNSPFTGPLVRRIVTRGEDILTMLTAVRREVLAATNQKQVPWDTNALTDKFYFNPGDVLVTTMNATSGEATESQVNKIQPPSSKTTTLARVPGQSFRDCPDVCPEMIVLPTGQFAPLRNGNGPPPARIVLAAPIAVGKFSVTFEEWDTCVTSGGCKHQPNDQGWGRGKRPVVDVSWNDTQQYVNWLNTKLNLNSTEGYRLLTSAEWEYSTWAGSSARTFSGKPLGKRQANITEHWQEPSKQTVEVGKYSPNSFGLYDAEGNTEVWVEDCHGDESRNYCDTRQIRGLSFASSGIYAFSARGFANSSFGPPGVRNKALGFRVARSL